MISILWWKNQTEVVKCQVKELMQIKMISFFLANRFCVNTSHIFLNCNKFLLCYKSPKNNAFGEHKEAIDVNANGVRQPTGRCHHSLASYFTVIEIDAINSKYTIVRLFAQQPNFFSFLKFSIFYSVLRFDINFTYRRTFFTIIVPYQFLIA